MTKNLIYQDPAYVQGQITSLQDLFLGLAQNSSKEAFREQSLERLELLKTSLLSQPVSDARLEAVDSCIQWIENVTG